MKITMNYLRTLLVPLLVIASASAIAQTTEMPNLAPYEGDSGYQEFSLGPDSWYVAFHGTRKHSMATVEAAWLARAAQLCNSIQKSHLVELKYVGERVLDSDEVARNDAALDAHLYKVAGAVYIPIFTPSGPREITPVLTPSKVAAVRCFSTDNGLRSGKTAVTTAEALASARKAGLAIPQ